MPTGQPIIEAEWERYREELKALYLEEDKSLGHIMAFMKTKYGFCPSKSQYGTAFTRWGFRKNLNRDDWKHVHHQIRKRKAEDKETNVYLNGILVPAKRVKKELSRYFPPSFTRFPSPDPCIPPANLFFRTPEGTTIPEIPHELAGHYTPAYQQSFAYQQSHSPALRDIVVQTPSDFATQTPPQLCHNFSPVYRQFIFSAPPYTPVKIVENLCVLRNLPEPGDLPWFQFHEMFDLYVKPRENLASSKLIPLPAASKGLRGLMQLFEALGSVECVLQAPSFPGKHWAPKFSTQRLRQPFNHSGLSEFLQYMVYLASNNLLDRYQLQQLFKWVCDPNNHSAIREFFSLKVPTVDAFARRMFEIALQKPDVAFVRILLDAGVDPRLRMNNNKTTLEVAVAGGNIELTRILLDAGVGVNDLPCDWWVGAFNIRDPKKRSEMIRMLLNEGADIKTWRRSIHGNNDFLEGTVLELAASGCSVELVKLLLKAGTHVNDLAEYLENSYRLVGESGAAAEDSAMVALLCIAASADLNSRHCFCQYRVAGPRLFLCLQVGEILPSLDAGAYINAVDWRVKIAPSPAAEDCHTEVFKLLLAAVANIHTHLARSARLSGAPWHHMQWLDLTRTWKLHQTSNAGMVIRCRVGLFSIWATRISATQALLKAVEISNVETFQLLIDIGTDFNCSQDSLLPAVKKRSIIEFILGTGVDVNLILATLFTVTSPVDIRTLQLLIDAGANVNAIHHSEPISCYYCDKLYAKTSTPLTESISYQSSKWLSVLLNSGANPNVSQLPSEGWTALQKAAGAGDIMVVRMLLEKGADINAAAYSHRGRTALQAALIEGHTDIAQSLLQAGADVNAPAAPCGGITALQAAAIKGQLGIAITLLRAGADPNAKPAERGGRTALQGAAEHGRLDMVQYLLRAGADIDDIPRAKKLAERNGHYVIIDILKKSEVGVSGEEDIF